MTKTVAVRSHRRVAWSASLLATSMLTSVGLVAPAHAAPGASAIPEIIVTATKSSQSLQKVPISVQALTPKILADHQVTSFDDYAKLLPSVSFQSFGPGQAQPYFRGITSGGDGLHSGSQPGTGIYLDETPVTTIANGLDIHLYDVARVEALSGPQGTLFGASSLSGTLRIITNAPDPSHFSAGWDVEGNTFTGGSAGGLVEAYVNEPITDKIAIRLVGFDEHDGGYIDNVFKERDYILSDNVTTLATNNAKYVKKNFNYTDTYGGRAALKVELNDNWTITPSVIYQNQDAEGNFLYNPAVGDLKTSDFSPEYNKDSWYQSALTVQGKIGDWDVLYSGGYFGRTVHNAQDYSYYSVAYDAPGSRSVDTFPTASGGYLDPNQHYNGTDIYTKESHELRLTSPQQYPLRAIGGVFYERQTDKIIANYVVDGLASIPETTAVPGAGDDVYYTNIHRIDRDFALFGELAYDILPNLTLTVGGRYFKTDNTLSGVSGFAGSNYFAKGTTEYGETHKANLSWKIDSQRLVYATYSTGFRPGGVNRRDELGVPPVTVTSFAPDTITNYEIGAKTTWMDGRLRINGAIFDEEWHNVQYSLSPPGASGITAIFNVGYARSEGIEGDVVYHLDDHWTVSGSGTVLRAKLTKTFCTVPITEPDPTNPANTITVCEGQNNNPQFNEALSGAELPIQPRYKVNMTARYDFNVGDYKSFLQGSLQTQGKTESALVSGDEAILGPTGSFTTVDLSAGFDRDSWSFQAFVQNVADTRGILGVNTDCSITYCGAYKLNYPTKPRLIGFKIGKKY